MGEWERRQVGKRESEKVRGEGSLRYPFHTFPLSHFPTISPAHSLTSTLPHFPTYSDRWRAGVGALPGPSGASEGSRWEALTAGQGAPTGQPVRPDRAPAGRMNRSHANGAFMRPAGAPDARVQHRWVRSADGASHRLPSSAPPARRPPRSDSTANSGEQKQKGRPEGRPLNWFFQLSWPIRAGRPPWKRQSRPLTKQNATVPSAWRWSSAARCHPPTRNCPAGHGERHRHWCRCR